MKKYKMLRMIANMSAAIAVLSFAGTGLFTLGYLSWGDNGAAVVMLIVGLLSSFGWLAIGGLIDLLIDIAQASFITADGFNRLADKKKVKDKDSKIRRIREA